MPFRQRVKISGFESSTLLDRERSGFHDSVGFHSGVPRENAVNDDRLAERALLQGAQSGLLDDRVSVDAEDDSNDLRN